MSNVTGLLTIDRSLKSCKYATPFCKEKCYNRNIKVPFIRDKLFSMDSIKEKEWQNLTVEQVQNKAAKTRCSNNRIRICAQGEPFKEVEDIDRLEKIIRNMPDWSFWIPTRAWINTYMRVYIESHIMRYKNAFVYGSTDPSHSEQEIKDLKLSGWSTTFFGDNDKKNMIKCPKSFSPKRGVNKLKRHCRYCNICFSHERKDILYKMNKKTK